jgi:hypothetical protein
MDIHDFAISIDGSGYATLLIDRLIPEIDQSSRNSDTSRGWRERRQ